MKREIEETYRRNDVGGTAQLAQSFKEEGMLGYVRRIQAVEKAIGCDVLRHQQWSGSEYIDGILSGCVFPLPLPLLLMDALTS